MQSIGGGGCGCNGTTCNGINILPTYCSDPACDFHPLWNPFMNRIWAVGTYGTADERQKYYVYYPANKNPNSPVVLLIHGGGWMTGPNPDEILGWPFSFSNNTNDNIVNDMLNAGYVVISMIYRLAKYADNYSEISLNDIGWYEQIQDVNSCVNHIKNNFPSCLKLNVNSLQVLGESAGGLLALDWAYTQANFSYVKSVISMYAPTNMNCTANYYYLPTLSYTCGNNFIMKDPNKMPIQNSNYPFYWINNLNETKTIFATVNPLTCDIPAIEFYPNPNPFPLNPNYHITTNVTNTKSTKAYFVLESCVKSIVTNPMLSTIFSNYSPKHLLGNSSIIPTFVMHGNKDWLVPYKFTTCYMKEKLISTGGLIDSLNSSSTTNFNVPTIYNSLSSKHLLKIYHSANHGWANMTNTQIDGLRADVLKWLNGHI